MGPKETKHNSQTLTFCTQDLKQKTGKAIRSRSNSTATGLDAANLNVAGDVATWDEEAGANCTEAEGPP